jgi:hypothetical protein
MAVLYDNSGTPISLANPLPVLGQTVAVGLERTRPADVTAYAIRDAVADSTSAPTVITFANVARVVGGTGYVTKFRALTDQAANVAVMRLHLFNVAPTPINDNAQQTSLYAPRASYLGYVDLPAMAQEGTGSTAAIAQNTDIRLAFACAAADRNLYGLLETLTAFTPASGQKHYLEITAELN